MKQELRADDCLERLRSLMKDEAKRLHGFVDGMEGGDERIAEREKVGAVEEAYARMKYQTQVK
jgi:hypothetical protein